MRAGVGRGVMSCKKAASATVRVIKPETPKSVPDCLNPTTPHAAAGTRSEPPPSEPCAARSKPRATCTAAPPEDPPGVAPGCNGLTGWGISTGSVSTRNPSSGVEDFPIIRAPCSSSAAMKASEAVALYARCLAPCDVGMPATSLRSFADNIHPDNRPFARGRREVST